MLSTRWGLEGPPLPACPTRDSKPYSRPFLQMKRRRYNEDGVTMRKRRERERRMKMKNEKFGVPTYDVSGHPKQPPNLCHLPV